MAVILDKIQSPKLNTPTLSSGGSLSSNTTYYYRVVAVDGFYTWNQSKESSRSNIVSITTDTTNLTVNLTWNRPAELTSTDAYYYVLRSTNKADLEGDESKSILLISSYPQTTTTTAGTESFTDDNSKPPLGGSSSRFWYREHGCPSLKIESGTFSSSTPGTMDDLYDADLAGTLELMPDEAATTDSPHNLRTPVNPADSLELQLDFIVSNYSASGTISVSGKDVSGNTVSENISVTGNGTYTTTNYYASIDENGITSTGTYDFKVQQNRWGYVWRYVDGQNTNNSDEYKSSRFLINCHFRNYDHFKSINEVITVLGDPALCQSSSGSFQLGEYDSSIGSAYSGSELRFATRVFLDVEQRYNLKLYASKIKSIAKEVSSYAGWGSSNLWWAFVRFKFMNSLTLIGSIWENEDNDSNAFIVKNTNNVIKNSWIRAGLQWQGGNNQEVDFGDTVWAHNGGSWLWIQLYKNVTIKNFELVATDRHISINPSPYSDSRYNYTFVNPTFLGNAGNQWNEPKWNLRSGQTNTLGFDAHYYTKYTHKYTVIDINGSAIESATVTLKDKNDNTLFTTTTDSNGEITEQEVLYATYTWPDNATGDGVKYAKDNIGGLTPESSIFTVSYSTPYTLLVSKSGYQTVKFKFSNAEKIDWKISMEKVKITPDQELLI